MGTTAVVTDTTHYMPTDVVERNDIHVVSLYVNWGSPQHQDREADLPDFDAFYDHLRSASDLPTTSQPSVGDFLEVYRPLLEVGRDIVSVHLSSAISGTCASASQAREQLVAEGIAPERIEIVDSASTCAGTAFTLLAAANAARAGDSPQRAAERALAARAETKLWFAVDTLEFLRRGGRIGGAQAWLGSTLRIKPILSFEAETVPVERVRTSKRAFERLVDYLRSRQEDGADAWAVQHIQAHEEAARLVERGREIYGTDPEFVSEIGPVVGTHAGPGLLGVCGAPRSVLGPF
jgi:DegV family protein with EDD domain